MFGIITGWRKEITETEMQSPWLDSYPGTVQLVVSILNPMLWGAYLNYIFRVILYQSFPFRFYFFKGAVPQDTNTIFAAAGSQ